MLLQNIRARIGARLSGDSEGGFTLIELLVVMLILGILAAIALPAFFNQKDKAGDAKAKEYAHTTQVAAETFATDHDGSYDGIDMTALRVIEPSIPSSGIAIAEVGDNGEGYKVTSTSSNGNEFFVTRATNGGLSFTCKTPNKGGCPAAADEEATESNWGD